MGVYSVLAFYLVVLIMAGVLLHSFGRRDRIATPVALFLAIELVAVWPTLVPITGGIITPVGGFPAFLAAIGLLGMVMTYVLLGGSQADATGWRGEGRSPDPDQTRSMSVGLAILVTCLTILGLISFQGLPPLLSGGLGSLVDPGSNADQATLIRETRLELTKGHTLLGSAYAGQGIINAVTEIGWRIAVIVATLCWSWKRTRASVQQLLVVCLLAFVFLGSAGSRAPLLLCVIAGVAAVAVRHRLRVKYVVVTASLVAGFALFIMPLAKGSAGGETVAERSVALVQRVTDGNGKNNAEIVRLVESGGLDIQDGGLFMARLQALVPGTPSVEPFALSLTRLAYGAGTNTTGYSTPTQYGLMYADGGPWAVLLGYTASGAVLALAWKRIVRIRSPLGAVVLVEGAILLGYVSVSGIHGILSSAPVAALMLLIAAGPRGWSGAAAALLPGVSSQKARIAESAAPRVYTHSTAQREEPESRAKDREPL